MRSFDMFVPESIDELLQFLDTHQSAVHIIANGTDLIKRIQRKQVNPKVLVDITGLQELKYVKKQDGSIKIGALTTISELTASPLIDRRYDVMGEVARRFGGPSIINMATVGGNICSASSSEDLLPVLLVLEGKVKVRNVHGERTASVESFVTGKRTTGLKNNEILLETSFPELDADSACSFEKIGMRNSLIIAFVNCATYLKMDKTSGVVADARIALNRVNGKIPQRARDTEKNVKGKRLNEESLADAAAALRSELKLTSDFRASDEYRTDVACAILKRTLRSCVEKISGEKIIV